jgi:uncharacterized protein (TIGR00369 family)
MTGDGTHWRKLEHLYLGAPTNEYYRPEITIGEGVCEIRVAVRPEFFHAAHAVHGSVYFKLLDDAGFFAANSVVPEVFVLTANFTIHLLRPVTAGVLVAKGRLISNGTRQLVADAQLFSEEKLAAHGVGTYARSRIALDASVGYR